MTLDLQFLNSVEVSGEADATIVKVGPGATWGTIYQKLDPLGLTVAGGRVAGVGVGGLTLGGGISHLSAQHGWTCDTVLNFQVVLSDGSIVDANANQNPDLFFALRGGSNNFGVVTRLDFETFPQGDLWTASLVCSTEVVDSNIREFVNASKAEGYDENASFIMSFAYIGSMGTSIIANTLLYTKPIANPPVYQGFMKLPTIQSSSSFKNMSTSALEADAMVPKGARSLYRTCTVVSTEEMIKAVYRLWTEAADKVKGAKDISWVLSVDPLPPAFYGREAGSNALGLTGREGKALLIVLLDVRWSGEGDDDLITKTARKLFDDVSALVAVVLFYHSSARIMETDIITFYRSRSKQRSSKPMTHSYT